MSRCHDAGYQAGRRDGRAVVGESAVVEWAINYPDPTPPMAAESEWRARSWAKYWNEHRNAGDDEAVVLCRTVIASDWTTATKETP